MQSQLRELQLAEVQAAAVGKSDHYRSLRVRGDRGANEAQRAPQLEVKDQCPAAAELKQQGLPAAADPFDALPSQRIGKCLRAVGADGGWGPHLYRRDDFAADHALQASLGGFDFGKLRHPNLHKLHKLHNYLRRLTTGHYRAACDCVDCVGRVGCVGSFQQSRHPSISVNPASGLTRRAIVGFLIGKVDCFDACAAARARLAPVPVHAEQLNRLARWQLRSKTGPVLLQRGSKYAPDGGVQPGHLVAGETRGRRKRRQLSFPQDLIRESVPDAHDMALLGDRAFQLSRFRLDGAICRRASRMRCMTRSRSSERSDTMSLPIRRTRSMRRPASALTGGSNVFTMAGLGTRTDTIV